MGGAIGRPVYESFIKGTPFEDTAAILAFSFWGIIGLIVIWSFVDMFRKDKSKRKFVVGPVLARIISMIISGFISLLSFIFIHQAYYNNLPVWTEKIEKSITPDALAVRRLYNQAFENSLIFSIVIFVILFVIFEYIYRNKNNRVST